MKTSTTLFLTAALVGVLYWFRKTIAETTQTIIGDITNNSTTVDPVAAAVLPTALSEPKVIGTAKLKGTLWSFFFDDGSVAYRDLPDGESTPKDSIALPPLGPSSKP